MTTSQLWLHVGTFTHEEPHAPGARGAGLITCAFDRQTGRIEPRHVFRDIRNSSYLALDEEHGWLFSTSESLQVQNVVAMLRRNADGSLTLIGKQPIHGNVGCQLCVLPDGQVGVASYLESCVTIFPVRNGTLAAPDYFHDYVGSGPNVQRQEASHAHQVAVAPNRRWFYVVDLGSDRIWQHALDRKPPTGIPVPSGYGPRHMAFHPTQRLAYVMCELNGRVLTFDWNATTGELKLQAETSSCPHRQPEHAAGAAIRVHPAGRTLYISDRQENELVVFLLEEEGRPKLAARFDSGGSVPRDFVMDPTGRWLVVANQTSHNLAVFELDPATGMPCSGKPQLYPLTSPGCVLFDGGS